VIRIRKRNLTYRRIQTRSEGYRVPLGFESNDSNKRRLDSLDKTQCDSTIEESVLSNEISTNSHDDDDDGEDRFEEFENRNTSWYISWKKTKTTNAVSIHTFVAMIFFRISVIFSATLAVTLATAAAASTAAARSSAAFVSPSTASLRRNTLLRHSPAPRHDVGDANPMDQMDPEQRARAEAYMEHQRAAPTIGFPADVRSLVAYNHGFAVMSTNSKS
jgi:hypothetical protein